ncbi:ATP-binding protein [Streptomyces sp. NA04227]|uniref:ATP-binding protein n=1 Tax=Streptomyces sp. NA04227 TaxID=2742136 RepID=UPI0020CA82F9|nr:ATP-binding protein [Streptomyces sp. NA04227]
MQTVGQRERQRARQGALPTVLLLAGVPESVRRARAFVRDGLTCDARLADPDHIDTVVLITSELVTNAIRYGTEPGDSVRVVLDADATRTRVEVHDPVRRRPRIRPASDERQRGRGLIILDALCPGRWGTYDIPFGKAVWAEVAAARVGGRT